MRYQDLNYLLSDLSGLPEIAITIDTSLDGLGLEEEDYEAIAAAIADDTGSEPDVTYVKCMDSVGDLLDYANGE